MKRVVLSVVIATGCLLLSQLALAQPYQQAPMLDEMVTSGEIPPLEERLPEEPLVLTPYHEIGTYGGTFRTWVPTLQSGESYHAAMRESLMRPLSGDVPVPGEYEPNLVTSWEISNDYTTVKLNLRRGVKWSDGDPFDAEDITFMVNHVWYSDTVTPAPPPFAFYEDGRQATVEAPDAYTVILQFPEPVPLFLDSQSERFLNMYAPSHYLKPVHPDFSDTGSAEAFADAYNWRNAVGRPTVGRYIITEINPTDILAVRNPYYWKVDPEGNQLPYIDRLQFDVISADVAPLQAISGLVDFKASHWALSDFPVLKENEADGNYVATIIDDSRGLMDVLEFNYDTANLKQREVFNNRNFRIAVSHAIDRSDIINTIYLGLVEPKLIPVNEGPAYNEEMVNLYLDYDPDKANALLDEAGLVDLDGDGWRDYADGERFEWSLSAMTSRDNWAQVAELIAPYLQEVGLFTSLDLRPQDLITPDYRAAKVDSLVLWTTWYPNPFVAPRWYDPAVQGRTRVIGVGVQQWFATNGAAGREPTEIEAAIHDLVLRGQAATDEATIRELAQELTRLWAENAFTVGLSGQGISPMVVNNRMGNLPAENIIFYEDPDQYRAHTFWHIEQWYIKSE